MRLARLLRPVNLMIGAAVRESSTGRRDQARTADLFGPVPGRRPVGSAEGFMFASRRPGQPSPVCSCLWLRSRDESWVDWPGGAPPGDRRADYSHAGRQRFRGYSQGLTSQGVAPADTLLAGLISGDTDSQYGVLIVRSGRCLLFETDSCGVLIRWENVDELSVLVDDFDAVAVGVEMMLDCYSP